MASNSHIEWTDATWNPVTGCSKISPGCKHCYAERMAKRLKAMGQPNYANGFRVTLHPHMLHLPLTWRKPRRVFVNSMSDLFHDDVPLEFIQQVFAVMAQANWHQYQLLTKRSARALELDRHLDWQPNVWYGVSIENADACGVPQAEELGPTWVETPKVPPTGTKLGPNRNALSLVFSVGHARK